MAKTGYDGYEALANAIVKLAAEDYMRTLKSLKRNPNSRTAKQEKEYNERFFRSGWYSTLTSVDGEYLIRRMKEAVGYEG